MARGLSAQVSPATLAFMRWSVATLAVLPFALGAVRREWAVIKANVPYLLVVAFLGVTIFNTLVYTAGHTTVALNLSLMSTTFPVFTVILSRIYLGEPITYRRVAGLCLAVCGVVVLVTHGDLSHLTTLTFARGDLWMLLASFIFAVYSILVRRKPAGIGAASMLICTFLPGVVMLAPWMAWEQITAPWPTFTPAVIGAVLYIGLLASVTAYFVWNHAVASIGPTKAGFVYYSLPAISGLEAYLILGEPVTWIHLVSGAMIIGGIIVASRR